MRRSPFISISCAFLLLICSFFNAALAQTEEQKLTNTILQKDSLFWAAFNSCDTITQRQFFTPDVEFYHDKGGLTIGIDNVMENTKRNLCSNNAFRLRREVVAGTVKVYPLTKSDIIYGAIISGEHIFYVLEKDKPARLDGHAMFTHVWLLKDKSWKMARVLSYGHQPALENLNKKETTLPAKVIGQWAGTYQGPQTGTITVQPQQNGLVLLIKDKKFVLFPEAENLFFSKERDLTFEFIKNEKNKVAKMIVREHGAITEEAKFVK